MPLRSGGRSHIESKFNVVTEYVDFNLHSAASKGNIALVQYALSQGQPPNSVLDGVLPIHLGASGGSELVVAALLEAGADVNAPRLPRKYSQDKSKTGSTIIGSSGCTALHFAAANGHVSVVRLLLEHGAIPNKADKHGVKPEDLAHEAGHHHVLDVLRAWETEQCPDRNVARGEGPSTPPRSRRIQVQRSIDNLFMRRPSQISPIEPPADSLLMTPRQEASIADSELPPRRPSLPTLFDTPHVPNPVPPRIKRPRSAGQDAEASPSSRGPQLSLQSPLAALVTLPPRSPLTAEPVSPATAAPSTLRKLGSKYSLLNLFKKANESSTNVPLRHHVSHDSLVGPLDVTFDQAQGESSPPKSPVSLHHWMRTRKMSEVTNPSPLASEITKPLAPIQYDSDTEDEFGEVQEPPRRMSESKAPVRPSIMAAEPHLRRTSSSSTRALRFTDPPATSVETGPDRTPLAQSTFVEEDGDSSEMADEVGESIVWGDGRAVARTRGFSRRGSSFTSSSSSIGSPNGLAEGIALPPLEPPLAAEAHYLRADDANRVRGGSMSSDGSGAVLPSPDSSTSPSKSNSLLLRGTRPAPLIFRSPSTHAEAQSLVQKVQNDILHSAELPIDSPDSAALPSLSEQLAAYGEFLQIERKFAKKERRRSKQLISESENDAAVVPVNGPATPIVSSASRVRVSPSGSERSLPTRKLSRAASLGQPKTPLMQPHVRSQSSGPTHTLFASPRSSNAPPLSAPVIRQHPQHRTIANMSLQHKHSLDARLKQTRHLSFDSADDDDDVLDGEFDVRVEAMGVRRPSTTRSLNGIQIIQTLATPTDSPSVLSSRHRRHGSHGKYGMPSSPVSSISSTSPPRLSLSTRHVKARTTQDDDGRVESPIDDESFEPLSRVFTAPPRMSISSTSSKFSSTMTDDSIMPQQRLTAFSKKTPVTQSAPNPLPRPVMGQADYAPVLEQGRTGKRFALKNFVHSLKRTK